MGRQRLLGAVGSCIFTIAILVGSLLFLNGALAKPGLTSMAQTPASTPTYLSISSMAFKPFDEQTMPHRRNFEEQILALDSATRQIQGRNNWFITPLMLPDDHVLTGLTFFGQDFDPAGWIEIALWRCPHSGDANCMNIPLSRYRTDEVAASGIFDSGKIALNEPINNQLYSYILVTKIIAINGSGLRSVLLELTQSSGSVFPPRAEGVPLGRVENWSLANRGTRTQLVEGMNPAVMIQICNSQSSAADVEVRYGGDKTKALSPGNCTRISGYSAYSIENVGLYGDAAFGTFGFLSN